jgi:hypothetical protein
MEVFDIEAYEAEQKMYREKYMADIRLMQFMYGYSGPPICESGFAYDIDEMGNNTFNCVPSDMVQQKKVIIQAKNGEGFLFRDVTKNNNTPTLVKTCPPMYAPRGIECVSYNDLNLTTAEYIALENARVKNIEVKDGVNIYYFQTQEEADKAKLEIDKKNAQTPGMVVVQEPLELTRQENININVCSVDKYGSINNPGSMTNGMNLSQYIGQFKVTDEELQLAKSTCPDSIVIDETFGTESYEKDTLEDLAINQAIVRKEEALKINNENLKKYALYAVLGVSAYLVLKNIFKKD